MFLRVPTEHPYTKKPMAIVVTTMATGYTRCVIYALPIQNF